MLCICCCDEKLPWCGRPLPWCMRLAEASVLPPAPLSVAACRLISPGDGSCGNIGTPDGAVLDALPCGVVGLTSKDSSPAVPAQYQEVHTRRRFNL